MVSCSNDIDLEKGGVGFYPTVIHGGPGVREAPWAAQEGLEATRFLFPAGSVLEGDRRKVGS